MLRSWPDIVTIANFKRYIKWGYHFFPMNVLVLLTLMSIATGCAATCQTGDSIVTKLSFQNTAGLTFDQKSTLTKLLIDRCFYQADKETLSDVVYRQLQQYGYRKAYVQDPIVRVLNWNVHPLPASVTVDFVTGNRESPRRK